MISENSLPTVALVQVSLEGEPATDKAFEHDGVTYRVRLIRVGEATLGLPNAKGPVAPFLQAFDLTITRLGDDGLPLKLDDGTVVILAQTRLTFDSQSAQGGLSVNDQVDLIIGNLIHQACQVGLAQIEIEALSQDWGGAVSAVATTVLPYQPPSLPTPIEAYQPPQTPEIVDEPTEPYDDTH